MLAFIAFLNELLTQSYIQIYLAINSTLNVTDLRYVTEYGNLKTTRRQFPALYPVAVIISVGILLTENIRLTKGTAKKEALEEQKYFLLPCLCCVLPLGFSVLRLFSGLNSPLFIFQYCLIAKTRWTLIKLKAK